MAGAWVLREMGNDRLSRWNAARGSGGAERKLMIEEGGRGGPGSEENQEDPICIWEKGRGTS